MEKGIFYAVHINYNILFRRYLFEKDSEKPPAYLERKHLKTVETIPSVATTLNPCSFLLRERLSVCRAMRSKDNQIVRIQKYRSRITEYSLFY